LICHCEDDKHTVILSVAKPRTIRCRAKNLFSWDSSVAALPQDDKYIKKNFMPEKEPKFINQEAEKDPQEAEDKTEEKELEKSSEVLFEEARENQKEAFYSIAKEGLGKVFRAFPTGEERVGAIITVLPMLINDEKERLLSCGGISDEQGFIENVFEVILRLVDRYIADEKEFKKATIERKTGFKMVGDVLSYGVEQNWVHVHFSPVDKFGAKKIEKEFGDLAKIIFLDPSTKKIQAESWIVAEYPALLERFGFTVEGPISKEQKEKYFSDEKRPVWDAYISRDDFLKRYLK